MVCDNRRRWNLEKLLKTDEPAYLFSFASERKKRTREDIAIRLRGVFHVEEESFEEIFGKTFDKMVDESLGKEESMFGGLDVALVPQPLGYSSVSETTLKGMLEKEDYYNEENRRVHEIKYPEEPYRPHKYVYAELKTSTTEALREIYKKCGLTIPEDRAKGVPRHVWMTLISELIETASKYKQVREIYLTGSLANGFEQSKDADVIVVTGECVGESGGEKSGNCIIKNFSIGNEDRDSLDIFCFDCADFETMEKDGGYRLLQNTKLLYRSN